MILQDPMTSAQSRADDRGPDRRAAEAPSRIVRARKRARRRGPAGAAAGAGAAPRAAELSARVERRHAPARRGGDRPGGTPTAPDRRRAHDGARCDRAGWPISRFSAGCSARRGLRSCSSRTISAPSPGSAIGWRSCTAAASSKARPLPSSSAAAHPYSRALLRSLPDVSKPPERLEPILGQPPSVFAPRKGCLFADRCPEAQAGMPWNRSRRGRPSVKATL